MASVKSATNCYSYMTKPFINDEQLLSIKKLLASSDDVNHGLAFSILQGFQLTQSLINELRTHYGKNCFKHGFYLPFHHVKEIDIQHLPLKYLQDYQNPFLKNINIRYEPPSYCSLAHFPSLETLEVFQYDCCEAPHGLMHLKHLTSLKVVISYLDHLPPNLGNWTQITHLDLSNCYLKELPASIAHLQNLRELNLYSNWRLEALPESIFEMKNLRLLNLRSTGIRDIRQARTYAQKMPQTKILFPSLEVPEYMGG